MRRLSGWARLWIVGAVLMWGAGGWWLHTNPLPPAESAGPHPRECMEPGLQGGTFWGSDCQRNGGQPMRTDKGGYTPFTYPTCEELQRRQTRCLQQQAETYRTHRATFDALTAENERQHLLAELARIAVVVVAPIGLAIIYLVGLLLKGLVMWVRRGFQRPPAN